MNKIFSFVILKELLQSSSALLVHICRVWRLNSAEDLISSISFKVYYNTPWYHKEHPTFGGAYLCRTSKSPHFGGSWQ